MVFAEPQSYYAPPQPQPQPQKPAYAYHAAQPGQAIPPGAIPVYANTPNAPTAGAGKPQKESKMSKLNDTLGVVSSGTQIITSFTN
jgi:hypothetical protein